MSTQYLMQARDIDAGTMLYWLSGVADFDASDLVSPPAGGVADIAVLGDPTVGGGLGAIGGAVSSVFGRTGTVTAQAGDYTAAQVGAVPSSATIGVAGLATGGGLVSSSPTIAVNYPTDQRFVVSVTTVAELRAVPSADFIDGMIAHRLGTLYAWEWDSSSSSTDDGENAVKPDDVSGNGRWMKVIFASPLDLFGTGDYDNELVAWDAGSNAWLLAADGVVAANRLVPASTVSATDVYCDNGTQQAGVRDGEAFLLSDASGASQLQTITAFGIDASVRAVVSARGGGLGYFLWQAGPTNPTPTEVTKRTVSGATLAQKVDAILAALAAGYNLVDDNTTPGDNPDYYNTSALATTDASSHTLLSLTLTDNAITRVVFIVTARDTGNNWYKYKYSQEYTRSAAGNATLLDGGEVAIVKNNISGFTGASINLPGSAAIEFKVAGSASVHANVCWKVWVDTIPIAAAT